MHYIKKGSIDVIDRMKERGERASLCDVGGGWDGEMVGGER